jgi:hypothetical protein
LGQTILLISASANDQKFAARIAEIAQASLVTFPEAADAIALIENDPPGAMLIDASTPELYQKFETAIQNKLGLFSDRINANTIHFLTNDNIEKIQHLIQSPLFGHYVLRNEDQLEASANHYGFIIKATMMDRAFGLKNLLSPQAKIQSITLKDSSQKQEAVDAIKNYFLAAKFKTRMATIMANAVDELLMNAIYDAPVDDAQRPLFNTTARNVLVELTDRRGIELSIGFDGNTMAVSASDQFGSLQKAKLLAHISKIYTQEEYKVRTSVAGAGIGLATVFRSGGSFLFVSEAGRRTEATVFFTRAETFREFKDQFRHLSTQFYF